ncbi:MAG: DsbA family oxidoreductase [Microthrixaceae bacterium]
MRIDVWSDLVCPWCYIGKRNLEAALATFTAESEEVVEVVWRSFELDPRAPVGEHVDLADTLAHKYGTDRHHAMAMMDRVSEVAEGVGLHYRFDFAKRSNTLDAHRVTHLARQVGGAELQGALYEGLLAAYFTEGRDLADRAVLAEMAAEAGLDSKAVTDMLDSDRLVAAVRTDEAAARDLGVTGVPCFVVEKIGMGLSGAQPPERLLQMLRRATGPSRGDDDRTSARQSRRSP